MTTQKEVWLITGAAGKLGAAMVDLLLHQGADCIALDKDMKGLEALDNACQDKGLNRPALYPMDLVGASIDDFDALGEIVAREFGRLDHLVHAANMFVALRPLMHQPAQEWMQIVQVAVNAPIFLTQALMPLLVSHGRGSVTWIIDELCLETPAHWGAYGMSQAARSWVAQALAAEVGPKGPSVHALGTADFLSPIRQQAWPAQGQAAYAELGPIVDGLIGQIRHLNQA